MDHTQKLALFSLWLPFLAAPAMFLPCFPAPWWSWICGVLCSQALVFDQAMTLLGDLLSGGTKKNCKIIYNRADNIYLCLMHVVVLSLPCLLAITPFSSTGGVDMPNLKFVPDVVIFKTAWVNETLLMPMPPHSWPTNVSALPTAEQTARPWYWLSFAATTVMITAAVGTAIISIPFGQTANSSFQPLVQVQDSDNDLIGDTRQMPNEVMVSLNPPDMRQLCRVVVVSFLCLTTKIVLHAAFTSRLTADDGLVFEAYCYFLVIGLSWMLMQAVGMRLLRRKHLPPTAFGGCLVGLLPYMGDAFDTLKDACFGGVALQHRNRVIKALGCVSLTWLWAIHLQTLWSDDDEILQMTQSYLPVFLLKEEAAKNDQQTTSKQEQAWLKFVVAMYKQTTPAKRKLLVKEDGPQGIFASIYTIFTKFHPFIVVQNIAIPILRYAFAYFFNDFFARSAVTWILQEFVAATIAGLHDQAMIFGSDFMRVFKNICSPGRPVPNQLQILTYIMNTFVLTKVKGRGPMNQIGHVCLLWLLPLTNSDELLLITSGLMKKDKELYEAWKSKANWKDGVTFSELSREGQEWLQFLILAHSTVDTEGDSWSKITENSSCLNLHHHTGFFDPWQGSWGSFCWQAMAELLKTNTSLRELYLPPVQQDIVQQAIAESLKSNTSLQVLHITDTEISDAVGQAMAEALKSNKTLRELKMRKASLGNNTGQALAEALKSNTSLQVLNMRGTDLEDATGGEAVAEALKSNTSLRVLDMSYTGLGDATGQAMAEALKKNTTLQVLNMSNTEIENDTGRAMAKALKSNTGLQVLNMSGCEDIGEKTGEDMKKALKSNTTLRELNLRGTKIKKDTLDVIEEQCPCGAEEDDSPAPSKGDADTESDVCVWCCSAAS